MPQKEILTSLHGRRLGLAKDGTLVVDQTEQGGVATAEVDAHSVARGQLTSAQILALNATPITVIAAPGAGKVAKVDYALFFLDYGTTGYTAGAGEDLVLRYTDGTGQILTEPVDGADFLDQTADTLAYARGNAGDGQAQIMVANAAVVAHIQSGEITGGDSPINYEIHYRVIDSTLPSS